jgi:hypothetical protein
MSFDFENHSDESVSVGNSEDDILSTPPMPQYSKSQYRNQPTWLISGSELKHRSASMQFDTLSIHLLSYGSDTACCLTFREIDNESDSLTQSRKTPQKISAESKLGVIGRIITGLRIKILEVQYLSLAYL